MKKIFLLPFVLLTVLSLQAQDGLLDSSFGTNGIVNLGSTFGDAAFQSDGKLLIDLTRYNADGSLDSSYGTNGTIIPKFVPMVKAFEPDGKLVIGGEEYVYIFPNIYHYFLFARYNLDGTVDNSFYGGQLKVLESYRDFQSPDRSGKLKSLFISNSNELAYIVRYADPGGSSYRIFRSDGYSQLRFYSTLSTFNGAVPYALAFTSDNRLLAGGYELGVLPGTTQPLERGLLEIYKSNGTLDSSFGLNGIVERPGKAITNIAVQKDLKILASQSGTNLLRYSANGTMDATFNDSGVVITPFTFNKMVTTSDGKIIIGGTLNGDFAIARYNANGTLDNTFGNNGITTSHFGNNEKLRDIALTNSRLLVYGTIEYSNSILAAYKLAADCIPPTFKNDGTIVLDASCGNNDGNISIIPTGGTAPFMYSIDGGTTYVSGANTGYTFGNLAAASYHLRLKDANGCESAIVEREVKLNCPCTPPTFKNDGTIVLDASCGNNDAQISIIPTSGTAPFMYSIDGGATYKTGANTGAGFTNLAPGTYKLRLKDANGCESSIVERTVRSIYGGPTFSYKTSEATCGNKNGSITIIPLGGAGSFMYSIDGGMTYVAGPSTGYTFSNLAANTYYLRVKNATGCESAIIYEAVKANFNNCTGATVQANITALENAISPELVSADAVKAYPNPTKGQFKLQLKNFMSQKAEVSIFNGEGKLVQKRQLNVAGTITVDFDLTGRAKGMYYIKITSNSGTRTSKVLVQ